ncbi:ABC transporter permease [Mesorhizobium sp. 1M-11]|uniref:ABC transporter permease n=1 Tax=Mesorhizobium sp. 1M-11 TaxID=1529006 RepID=UPI0006C763B1|nr:ABC transporter permease [Mesorhizobium sp. 1M-11]
MKLHVTRRGLLLTYVTLFFIYLEGPLAVIVLSSFNSGQIVRFPPEGFSLKWYGALMDLVRNAPDMKPELLNAVYTSLWLGVASTIGAVIAGTLGAYALQRAKIPGTNILRQLFLLPLLFPQIVTGIGLVLWFSAVGGVPTWMRLLLGHLIISLPCVVVTVTASLETLDRSLEDAAMNLGANRVKTFLFITLPSIQGGVLAGAIFAWLTSFSNFTVTYFLFSGEMNPFPLWLYQYIEYYIDPGAAALATCVLLITLSVLLMINRLQALGRVVAVSK